jgi:hypothetical protein
MVIKIEDHRGVGDSEKAGWSAPSAKMVMGQIQRHGEEASRLPGYRMFPTEVIRNDRAAFPGDNEKPLLIHVSLRPGALSRAELADIRVVGASSSFEIDIGAQRADPLPRSEL